MSFEIQMGNTGATSATQIVLTVLGALCAGVLFGVGLLVSGMANPAKVLNFLDVAGSWDPSLAFVMGGAVIVTLVGYPLIQKRSVPMLMSAFQLPTRKDVDVPLVAGAVLFGIGWGLAGYCPGPVWVSVLGFNPATWVFLLGMLAGMWIVLWQRNQTLSKRG